MNHTIRTATQADLPVLHSLTQACVTHMRSQGIEQWDEVYPAEGTLSADIDAGTLWIMNDGDTLAGCVTLDETQDPLWQPLNWRLREGRVAAIHRVMVHPALQGRGLAKQLMTFAESRAGMRGYSAVRLDTFIHNPTAVALYEKRGYTAVGTAEMRKGTFLGMEKPVSFPQDGWPVPEPCTFIGRHITLTPLDIETDASELFSISHAGETTRALWTYLPEGPFEDLEGYKAFLCAWTGKPDVIAYTVRQNETGHPLGSISLMRITPQHGVAELGNIWYAPAAQRTAANTEAVFMLLRHCFDDLGYRRMEWKCNDLNEPSRRAALRLGFQYEGTFHQHMVLKGANRHTAWYAMMDHEWPARRRWFQERLARDA